MKRVFTLLVCGLMALMTTNVFANSYGTYDGTFEGGEYVITIYGSGRAYLSITTHGKQMPDFGGINSATRAPWVEWEQRFGGTDEQAIISITTDAPNISVCAFVGMKKVRELQADNCKTVGQYAFEGCFEPGATIQLPNVEEASIRAFYGCNAGVIALPKIKKVPYECFLGCPALKQVDFGEDLTEIQGWAFGCCPMMWIDDEPNIFLHGTKAPKIARGYYNPSNTILIGFSTPQLTEITYPWYYGTCYDNDNLRDKKLYPYVTSAKKKKNCSQFHPQPDGYNFEGKPVIVIPKGYYEADNAKWQSLINAWKDDADFVEGGRVETNSISGDEQSWRDQYIGWWHRGAVGANTDIHICTYRWPLKEYISEELASDFTDKTGDGGYDPTKIKLTLHDNLSSSLISLRKKQLESGMPWMDALTSANVLSLHVKTPRIIPLMFGPALNCLEKAEFEGVTEIGAGAFAFTGLPNDIDLSQVTEIGAFAFQLNNFLKEVTLTNIEEMGYGAFWVSPFLTKAVIGDYLTTIPVDAFCKCSRLKEVYVGKKVSQIDTYAFATTDLDSNNSEYGLFMSAKAPQLGNDVFNQVDLSKVYLHYPGGEYASYDADGSVWRQMNRVSDIAFPIEGNGWSLTADGLLTISKDITVGSASNQPWGKYRRYIAVIRVTDDVTKIDDYAFYSSAEQSRLKVVYLGKSVKNIGKYAFAGNDELEGVITYSGEDIYYNEFDNSNLLLYPPMSFENSVYLSTVETLGDGAFQNCNNIDAVYLGEKMQTLGSYLFKGCPLWYIAVYNTTPLSINKYTFAGTVDYDGNSTKYEDIYCHVRNNDFSAQLAYLTTTFWSDFHYDIDGLEVWYNAGTNDGNFVLTSDSVMHIWPAEGKTEILPYGVWDRDAIAWDARTVTTDKFGSNNKVADKVKQVVFTGNITEIGGACCFLPNLTEAVMPETVKRLRGTFYGCESLEEISLPSVEDLGGAEGITLSSNVLRFDKETHGVDLFMGTFAYCPNLKCVLAPNLTIIADSTFTGCVSLDEECVDDMLYYGNVKHVGRYAFKDCKSLTYANLTSVEEVQSAAFAGCSNLEEVWMGNNNPVYRMFEGCYNLETVYMKDMIGTIGNKAFNDCNIKNIYIETPNPPYFSLNAKENIKEHIFSGQNLGEINVYTRGDFISRYREVDGWKEMTVRVIPGSETSAAIPVGGYITDENYTNPAKWEITVGRSLNIYGEGVLQSNMYYKETTKTNYLDPRVSYFWDYIDQIYINKGITEINVRLMEGRTGSASGAWEYCKNIYIPSTMEKICALAFNELAVMGGNKISDVYCYAVNPPDISYTYSDVYETMRMGSTAFGGVMMYISEDDMSKNEELRNELCIPRLHVLRDSGVKEAYEAAPGYNEQFLEIIADLVEGDEVVIPNNYSVTFVDWDNRWISTQVVEDGTFAAVPDALVREGYIFKGWEVNYVSEPCEDCIIDKPVYDEPHNCIAGVNADLVVRAIYDEIPVSTYTVFFLDWDGTELKKETVSEGQDATAPADPVRDGYKFIGWNRDFSNVTEDMIVIAEYEKLANGIETVRDNTTGKAQKLLINGRLVILMPDGRIFDTTGKKVK